MTKRIALLFAVLAAATAVAAPAASASAGAAKPDPICFMIPDLDGHVYGPYCIG